MLVSLRRSEGPRLVLPTPFPFSVTPLLLTDLKLNTKLGTGAVYWMLVLGAGAKYWVLVTYPECWC